jgi:hypothetical protein
MIPPLAAYYGYARRLKLKRSQLEVGWMERNPSDLEIDLTGLADL